MFAQLQQVRSSAIYRAQAVLALVLLCSGSALVADDIDGTVRNSASTAAGSNMSVSLVADQQLTDLLRVSGVQRQINAIPKSAAQSLQQTISSDAMPALFESVDTDALNAAVTDAFSAPNFDLELKRELGNRLQAEHIVQLMSWYQSPLGRRLTAAGIEGEEQISNDPLLFGRVISQPVDDYKRALLIAELDAVSKTSEAMVAMLTTMQIAFNLSLAPVLSDDEQMSASDIITYVTANEASMLQQYREITLRTLQFTYRDFSRDELRVLIRTIETDAGQAYIDSVAAGIHNAMYKASSRLGDSLSDLVKMANNPSGI